MLALLGTLAPTSAQEASPGASWQPYRNERFGLSLSYPADVFQIERTSEAGDGVVFVARGVDARLLVGALPNSDRQTPASYQEFIARRSYADYQIHYRPRGSNWFVLSGEGNGKIFYEKVMFSCGGRLINSFALMYPADQRHIFDPIVERVEDTFRPGTRECQQGASTKDKGSRRAKSMAPRYSRQARATRQDRATRYPRSALANRIARARGTDVLVIMRRAGPPYDYKVVRGYASR